MARGIPQQKIDDCRELYLRHGGMEHARIVAEMRGLGWAGFTDRNLYVRTRRGKPERGWPERFGWNREIFTAETRRRREEEGKGQEQRYQRTDQDSKPSSSPRLRVSAVNKNAKTKHGRAFANRRASERTVVRAAALEIKPKFNRQKARRLRRERERELYRRSLAPVHSPDSIDPIDPPDPPDFHSWLKSLPSIWDWDAKHQLYLYDQLQKVTDGKTRRLMIFMPPRHGKSELVTVRYTAWRLRQDPSLNVIVGSYSQDLANRFSRKIKRVLIDDWEVTARDLTAETQRRGDEEAEGQEQGHQRPNQGPKPSSSPRLGVSAVKNNPEASPFPFTRSRLVNRVSEWETTKGGGLRAVGVGAGVTGYGASLIVIDDPVKSREQANSRRFRDKVWDWYNDDLRTRLEPDGTIILIQTRWHQDDLAGRLLEQEDGEEWTVINLPALAEGGREELIGMKGMEGIGEDKAVYEIEMTNRGSEQNDLPNISFIPSIPVDKPAQATESEPPEVSGGLSEHHVLKKHRSTQYPTSRISTNPPVTTGGSDTCADWRNVGDALWPDRFDVDALEEIKRRQGDFSFASLYQQRPVPQEGGVFKREWFTHIVEQAPPGLHWKRGYDLAVSTSETADYTATFRVAYDQEGNLYIDRGIRRRIGFPEQKRLISQLIRRETDTEHGIEKALHGHGLMQELQKEARLHGRRFLGVRVKEDKHTRALKWQTLAADGRLRLVQGIWIRDFVEEVCTFPQAAHDDQLDAVSLAVQMHETKSGKLWVF